MAEDENQEMDGVLEVWEARPPGSEPSGIIGPLKEPREWTNLAVIDICNTIFDPDTGDNPEEQNSMLLYLHRFLRNISMMYDILIWCKTTRDIIESKMERFQLIDNPDYNIIGFMDKYCMGMLYGTYHTIPLKRMTFIWDLFGHYNISNTVLCDVIGMCIMLRREDNGIPVGTRLNLDEGENNELMKLAEYLTRIYKSPSVCNYRHLQWHKYVGYKRIRKRKHSMV